MKTENINQTVMLSCTPEEAYEAWMDSKKHGEMIDGSANIDNKVGGRFNIWDGAVVGETLELHSNEHKIVQSWRYDYDDWPKDKPSRIVVQFIKHSDGCKVVFSQSGIPGKYVDDIAKGWKEYYWEPMKDYFSGQ